MTKIGRNDLCPCGSGKKNKKCCNISKTPEVLPVKNSRYPQMETYVKNHESHHLLNEIIAMQLLPENHGKNIRIENLAVLTVRNLNTLSHGDSAVFQNLLREEFSYDVMEDPVENLFTENLIFFGGNHIVFPGIASHPVDILRHITHIIFNTAIKLPEPFRRQVSDGLGLLLFLGDLFCDKAGLAGNTDAPDTEDFLIADSSGTDFSISEDDLKEICERLDIDPGIVNQFIIPSDDKRLQDENPEFSPLLFYPIVKFNQRYYYLLISNQVQTLNEYIFRLAAEYNCQQTLMEAYRDELWERARFSMHEMGWKQTDIPLKDFGNKNAPKEGVFHFDNNRLAYVILDTPLIIPDFIKDPFSKGHPPSIPERIDNILSDLKTRPDFNDEQFLILYLYDAAGRYFMSGERKPQERELRLAFSIHDFIILAKGEDWDHLSLWKFAKALNNFRSKVQSMAGTIELYSMYKQKSSGFYFSDDVSPNFLTIVPGEGTDLIRATKLKDNFHAAPIVDDGNLAYLPVESLANFAPIYKPTRHMGYFIQALESYAYPIWLINRQVRNNRMATTVRLYVDAVGFWLFKLTPGLSKYLNPVMTAPIKIIFELDKGMFDEMTSAEMIKLPQADYNANYKDGSLTISFPLSSLTSFIGPTNAGEREMMRNLLKFFNLVPGVSIAPQVVDELLDAYMPLGQAKMILIADSEYDLMIDRRWMIRPFLMTDAEVEMLLDEIPVLIEAKISIPEKIDSDSEKKLLFNTATSVLLEKLASEIRAYDHAALLTALLQLNESLIQKREYDRTLIPAQLICFGGMEEKIDEIITENARLVRTSLSLRNLTEYVAAKPTAGTLLPGFDDIDRLLALMHEITNFGMMSDALHFKMDDPEVGKLPSGRIAFTSKLYSEKIALFASDNAKANIDDNIESFDERFEINQPSTGEPDPEIVKTLEKQDKAFLTDWGISWSHLYLFFHYAAVICIEAETSVVTLTEKEFLEKMAAISNIPVSELHAGLERLALSPRDEYLKAPSPYVNNDVFPWKYNREFSLNRRFIVKHIDQDGNMLLTWGFRAAIAARHQLHNLFYGARLNNGGEEISKLIGNQAEIRGKSFRNLVKDWLTADTDFKVISYEVDMSPGGTLDTDKPYGDIDLLALHLPSHTVFSIECKNTTQAKNVHEMKTEMDRYLGREGKKGMIDKHIARHEWLAANTDKLQNLFKVTQKINVKSVMVSSQIIPTTYIKMEVLPMPIIAFPDLKRKGPELLLNAKKNIAFES